MSNVPLLPANIDRCGLVHDSPKDNGVELDDVPIENFRPFKVIVIGSGFSGINCAIRIPQRLRNVDLTVYEKNSDVGGTWWENRYPGCACDVPGKDVDSNSSLTQSLKVVDLLLYSSLVPVFLRAQP
jgi:succinate dehydrogenase/fumarate reductase flavoprotein subunit